MAQAVQSRGTERRLLHRSLAIVARIPSRSPLATFVGLRLLQFCPSLAEWAEPSSMSTSNSLECLAQPDSQTNDKPRLAGSPATLSSLRGPRTLFVPKRVLSGSGTILRTAGGRDRSSVPAQQPRHDGLEAVGPVIILLDVVGRSPVGVRLSPVQLTLGRWPRVSLYCPSGQPLRHCLRCLGFLEKSQTVPAPW